MQNSDKALPSIILAGLSLLNSKNAHSPVENQNDLELDFKVVFFIDSCCSGILLDESH